MNIKSEENSKIKLIKSLKTAHGRKKNPYFILENPQHIADTAQKNSHGIEFILHTPPHTPFVKSLEVKHYTISSELLEKLSDLKSPSGIIAICKTPHLQEIGFNKNLFPALICDTIEKPANIGAIIRNAAAFNIQSILLTPNCVNPFHPTAIKAMAGHCYHTPIYYLTQDLYTEIIQNTIPCYNLTPKATKTITDIPYIEKTCWVISSESKGLQSQILYKNKQYLQPLKIPISAKVDSLNASVACGIALFMFNFYIKNNIY